MQVQDLNLQYICVVDGDVDVVGVADNVGAVVVIDVVAVLTY